MSTRRPHTCRPARPVVEWASTGYEQDGGWRLVTRCGVKVNGVQCCAVLDEQAVTRDGADGPRAQDSGEEGEVER